MCNRFSAAVPKTGNWKVTSPLLPRWTINGEHPVSYPVMTNYTRITYCVSHWRNVSVLHADYLQGNSFKCGATSTVNTWTCCFPTSRAILPWRWRQQVPQCWYVLIFITLMSWNLTHEIMEFSECEGVFQALSWNSTARSQENHERRDNRTSVLTSTSTVMYYLFARHPPSRPPPPPSAFVHRTSPVSNQRSTLLSWIQPTFPLDFYIPAFNMLPSLDSAHNSHSAHTDHISNLLKTLHRNFTTPEKGHKGRWLSGI